MDFIARARERQRALERAELRAQQAQASHKQVLLKWKSTTTKPAASRPRQPHAAGHGAKKAGTPAPRTPLVTAVSKRRRVDHVAPEDAALRSTVLAQRKQQQEAAIQDLLQAALQDTFPAATPPPTATHSIAKTKALPAPLAAAATRTSTRAASSNAVKAPKNSKTPGHIVKVRGTRRTVDLRQDFLARFAEDIHATTLEHPLALQAADAPPHVKLLRGGLKHRAPPEGHTTQLDAHYWVPEALLEHAFGSDWSRHPLITALTVIPNEGVSFRKNGILRKAEGTPFQLWGRDPARPKQVGLPPAWGLSMFGRPTTDLRVRGAPLKYTYDTAAHMKERPEQRISILRTLRVLDTWGRALMIQDCAMGKTFQVMRLLCRLRVRTLFVVPSNIATQTVEAFRATLVATDPATGRSVEPSIHCWQGTPSAPKPHQAFDITIVSQETLKVTKVPPETFLQYGFVAVDEGHTMVTGKGVNVFGRFFAAKVVCVTATPMRLDNTGYVLPFYFGPVAVNVTRELLHRHPETQDRVMAIKVLQVRSNMPLQHEALVHMTPAQREDVLALDPTYTADAVWAVEQAKREGCKEIYVLTRRLNHLRSMWLALARYFHVPVATVPLVYGGMNDKQRQAAYAAGREVGFVVVNLSCLEAGFDRPSLDCLVQCVPAKNAQQMTGRVERLFEGMSHKRIFLLRPPQGRPNILKKAYDRQLQFFKRSYIEVTNADSKPVLTQAMMAASRAAVEVVAREVEEGTLDTALKDRRVPPGFQ